MSISLAQSISIFGNTAPNATIDGGVPRTFGIKFWSTQSGTISAIRFYRSVSSSEGYVAKLYSAGGILLGSVSLAQEPDPVPGWQVATLASPIPISANTTYIAAYYSPVGYGAWQAEGLSNGATYGPLVAPVGAAVGGNGVYSYKNFFPRHRHKASNYYVDILFTPTPSAAPHLVLNFNPPNPSIPATAPLGSVVATIIASWSDGSPFTGTLSFAPPYSNELPGRFCDLRGLPDRQPVRTRGVLRRGYNAQRYNRCNAMRSTNQRRYPRGAGDQPHQPLDQDHGPQNSDLPNFPQIPHSLRRTCGLRFTFD
jgi:hypothetical protein